MHNHIEKIHAFVCNEQPEVYISERKTSNQLLPIKAVGTWTTNSADSFSNLRGNIGLMASLGISGRWLVIFHNVGPLKSPIKSTWRIILVSK